MLKDKRERERSSHDIAEAARHLLTPFAEKAGARIAVVEMPPGPPVLQTVVAEVYGPDEQTRRQTSRDLMSMFEKLIYRHLRRLIHVELQTRLQVSQ